MLFSLEGKTALITGGSRGIGRVTAIEFAEMGADIAISSRKPLDLEKVADEIKALGRKCLTVSAHMGKREDIDNLVNKVRDEFGRIDILVNNAGVNPAMASMLDAEERLWDSIMNVNLKGCFFLSQGVARIMKGHGGGKIINVSSIDAFKPEKNIGIYAISKAGVIMLTRVMALELAEHNIKVNCIAPGNVHTRFGDSRFTVNPDYEKELIKKTPLGRIAEADEIVGAMLYLASDASNYMTGETIIVDGGILLT